MLPGVSRIRHSQTPGANLPAPVSKPRSCVSRALSRIPIEQLPLFFSKQSLPLRGLCFFLVLPCGFVQMHPFISSRSLRRFSSFSRLPPCGARLPAVQMDVSQKSRAIIPKNAELSGKTRGLFPAYSAVSRFCRHRRSAHPRVFTELPDARKHRVPILCINSAAFSLFPSVGKIWAGIFHSHFYILSRQFHNKAFSTPNLSQLSQNSQPKIPTCSDCPRTIMYLISHFKNFSL